MNERIRWGILGTGKIARVFAADLALLLDAELVAVGSRRAETAERFGAEFNVPHRHASYEALVNNPAVDVIYIATPHGLHRDHILLCLNAGKAVLCEKPFTLNARQADECIRVARAKRLFLMEAMWTRYIPLIVRLRQLLAEGVIGELQMLLAGLGKPFEPEPGHYLYDLALGGGALLDAGVYPVSLASLFFGPPAHCTGLAAIGPTGVDEQDSLAFSYDDGRLASLYVSLRAPIPPEFSLHGRKGRIRVHAPLFNPTRLTLSRPGEADRVIEEPFPGGGMQFEAAEVIRCLRAGQLESATMPLDETLQIMGTLDALRAQWGLKYPME